MSVDDPDPGDTGEYFMQPPEPPKAAKVVIPYVAHPPRSSVMQTRRKYVDAWNGSLYIFVRDGVWAVIDGDNEDWGMSILAKGKGPKGEDLDWQKVEVDDVE